MSAVVSKNLYELLGNSHDEDSDREPEPPVIPVDKTPARTNVKRNNVTGEAPASRAPAPARGGRRGGYNGTGNEAAFRDRNAGSGANSARPTDEQRSYDRSANRGTGPRRGGHPGDRRPRNFPSGSEKQAEKSWGAVEGGAELADEQAGEQIAHQDEKVAEGEAAAPTADAAEPEPEDHSISYSDYLAQLAEKKLALAANVPEPRKPNEGTKQDKKWASAKPITNDEDEDFIAGSGGKTKRERERKQKQVVEIDQRYVEPERGARGGFRGGRGRGDGPPRGGRGGRGDGTRGRGRGESYRGGRGAPRGGAGASINTEDTTAFPSLGSA